MYSFIYQTSSAPLLCIIAESKKLQKENHHETHNFHCVRTYKVKKKAKQNAKQKNLFLSMDEPMMSIKSVLPVHYAMSYC
jgi:hypothetical protein